MTGRTFRSTAYYVCAPKPGYVPPGHDGAASAYLREDHLLDGLSEFLATRVFGSYRENILDASLRELDAAARHDRQQQVAAARRAISDNEARSRRLLSNFELVEEPDQELTKDINARRAELRAERARLNDQLADLQEQSARAPNPGLLARLPVTPVDLTGMPDEVSRQLFEALRLEMTYDHEHHQVRTRVTLTGDTIDTVSRTTEAVVLPFRPRTAPVAAIAPGPHGSAWCPQRDSNPCRRLERAVS